jgi:lipoprotein Spr
VELHRRSIDQYKKDVKKKSKKKLRSGDLVFFATGKDKTVSHVGVYLKDDKFLHASSQRGVVVSDLNQKYYKDRFIKGGRVK